MIINNVKLVLENEVVHGSLEVQDGKIRAFAESQSRLPEAMDGEGGWLLPVCLQVSPEILRQRLENRGRENASEINARLARAARYTPQDC
ncbi:hypothetical protein ACUC97_30390, partial [Escherichia coli]